MFVLSLKTSKKNLILWGILLVVFISVIALVIFNKSNVSNIAQCEMGEYELKAQNNSERIQFLSQFGWHVQEEPVEVSEVTIPSIFNDTYVKYNEIQKQQGLDLSKYKEKSCKKFTYTVLNYPKRGEEVHANILVLDDKVIGGDISSTQLNGFLHGFVMPKCSQVEDAVQTSKKVQSTARETLDPDPRMPEAPTD